MLIEVYIMLKKIVVVLMVVSMTVGLFAGCTDKGGESVFNMPVIKAETIGSEVVKANSQFAFDIFKAVSATSKGKNFFLSPASISTALAMTWNGAEGETRKSMAEVLGFDDRNVINNGFAYLVNMLNRNEASVKISLANSIWIREGFPVLDEFKNVNSDFFAAAIRELNFSDPGAADIINGWVKKNTKGLIETIVDDEIDNATIMFLINTIYFKGNWKVEFNPDKTYTSDFFKDGTKIGSVEMMSDKKSTLYHEADEFKMISLPYGDGGMFMDLILPDEGTNLSEFIEEFSIKEYEDAIGSMHELDDVIVGIPKFKTEYKTSLRDALVALGMENAFSGSADFTGINKNGSLAISDVKHKSYIEVNEKGTEAAAVTSVEMKLTAIMEPLKFVANRPFIYTIRDDKTDTILFMGAFTTP
jgi:serpin B